MATRADADRSQGFVGRIRELETVRSVIDDACSGRMGALLVIGDAGVGKTRLVECVTMGSEAEPDPRVLSGACLPLSTMSVPLVPLRTALRNAPADLRPPALSGAAPDEATGGTPVLIDDWFDRVCEQRPAVLVVDDLQWADESTLDVLLFVIAGSAERRLAVVATLRSGEVGTGHPLHRWLADVRRMPCFAGLSLGPLARDETRDQLAALHGVPPHESLVTEVHARSGGNAYLNRLLVEALPPGSRHLDADLPGDLRMAVLRAWHRLSPPARELVRVIAVGGEVATGCTTRCRPRPSRPTSDLSPEESRQLHAAFTAAEEHDLAAEGGPAGEPDGTAPGVVEAVTAIADHHHRAGHPLEAYQWALRAVDAGERAGAGGERLRLLRRAVSLREHLGDVEESTLDLLLRRRTTAASLAPTMCEWLMPLAARGLADLVEGAREHGETARRAAQPSRRARGALPPRHHGLRLRQPPLLRPAARGARRARRARCG